MFLKKKEPKQKKEPKVKVKAPKEKKPKRLRKHFSILELVSIVTLLAISGTVGFLVYKNHFRKQIPETDKELVNQLNQSVSKRFAGKGKLDLTEVIDGIEKDGILFSRISFAEPENELVFDENENTFGILEYEKGVTYPTSIERKEKDVDPTLWKFAKRNPSDLMVPFSYYLLDSCKGKVTVIGGLDVGKNEDIERVAYINAIDKKQTVTIKTNSYETEMLVTETVGDTINHYGRLGKLSIQRLHTDSYHEYGDTKYAFVPNGRVVAEKGGNIDVALVTSEVAYLQEKNGTIGEAYASTARVRNGSNKADEKYGKKKPLQYDENLSTEKNEEKATVAGEQALNTAIVAERIERGLENHPNAIGYTRIGDTITVFDSYFEAVDFFKEGDTGVVTITGSESLSDTLVISNKNITFRASENSGAYIRGNIEVMNTSGKHKVRFENIKFINTDSNKHGILDQSECEDENKVNNLEFSNCSFVYNGSRATNKATIALSPVNDYIGTRLVVEKCKFEYESHSQIAISTRVLRSSDDDSINRGEKILSYTKHLIDSNTFKCKTLDKSPAIVSSYANITNNTFENYDTVFDMIPTLLNGGDCQFNVSVASNQFNTARYLFNLVDFDSCFESELFNFEFYANSYKNVENVGYFDVETTNKYLENTIEEWKNKSWYGVKNPNIGVTLDSITLDLIESPSFGIHTLSTGERIKTYTQVSFSEEEPRIGYTLKDVEGNTYYLYTKFNKEVYMFLKDGTNESYIALLGYGDVESLKVKELEFDVDWLDEDIFLDEDRYNNLKYFDASSEEKVGALYKLDNLFTTINGNTFVNCLVSEEEQIIKVSELPEDVPDVEPEEDPGLRMASISRKYQELESITLSSVDGYFDTGLVINDAECLNIEMDAIYTGENSGAASFFGFENIEDGPKFEVGVSEGNYQVGINSSNKTDISIDNERHIINFVAQEGIQHLSIDDSKILDIESPYDVSNNALSLYLGAKNLNDEATNFSGLTIYSFEIATSNEEHRFVPCRRISDGVLGFYDVLAGSNQFKELSGEATAGAEIKEDIAPELYISDIGNYSKLVLTNEENPFVIDKKEFIISVPTNVNVVLSGKYNVEIKGTLESIKLRDRLHVTTQAGSSIKKFAEISGENAESLKLDNSGYIENLIVNSKSNITNNSVVKNLITGKVGFKYIEETLEQTSGAFIYNKGSISSVTTYGKTELLNYINGSIEDIVVTYVEGYEDLCAGTSITNNGTMCTGEGNISLYIECKLFNFGLIGFELRTSQGGLIIVGKYGESDAHDGVVINNITGVIWAGLDEDNNKRTIIVYGVKEEYETKVPEISIASDGVIAGISSDDEIVFVIPFDIKPIIDESINN